MLIENWTLGIAMGIALVQSGVIEPTPEVGFTVTVVAGLMMMFRDLTEVPA